MSEDLRTTFFIILLVILSAILIAYLSGSADHDRAFRNACEKKHFPERCVEAWVPVTMVKSDETR